MSPRRTSSKPGSEIEFGDVPEPAEPNPELEALFWSPAPKRSTRHEAGHAVAAWVIYGLENSPPIERIFVSDIEVNGVLEGEVKLDDVWYQSISIEAKATIALAGVFAQDGVVPLSRNQWREMLSKRHRSFSHDYKRLKELAAESGSSLSELQDAALSSLLKMLDDMRVLVEELRLHLKPGSPMTGEAVGEVMRGAVAECLRRSREGSTDSRRG